MKFSNGQTFIAVGTVGQLIDELKRLPPDLPVNQDHPENGSEAIIFNTDLDDAHLSFKKLYLFTDGLEEAQDT